MTDLKESETFKRCIVLRKALLLLINSINFVDERSNFCLCQTILSSSLGIRPKAAFCFFCTKSCLTQIRVVLLQVSLALKSADLDQVMRLERFDFVLMKSHAQSACLYRKKLSKD